jgi:tetratricopeptide (TPR) repeat protein
MQHTEYTPPDATTPVTPGRFAALRGALTDEGPPHGRNHVIAYSVLAAAVVLAAGALFVLPDMLESPTVPPSATTSPAADAAGATGPISAVAPDADPLLTPAEQAAARLDAQNALGAVLQLQGALGARRAKEWAAAEFSAATTQIAAGETAYREQRFPAALRAYAAASEQLRGIEKLIPETVSAYIDEGERAVLSQDSMGAQAAFERALALAPDNGSAQAGLARAQSLDRVIALVAEAQGYERVGDSERARSAYREALNLDPAASAAAQALERMDLARSEQEFAQAMSAGYKALEAQQFDAAKTSFERASKLRPAATEARNALQQTALRASAARLEQALQAAANHERAERWNEAAGQYRAALAIDKALEVANSGLQRASTRAALDLELEKTLAQVEQLGEDASYRQAQTVLDRARAAASPGPRLQKQVAALSAAITRARTPVTVVLVSDGLTSVSIQRIGSYAPFAQQQLTLLAGRYTALGTREGYRDVRVEFAVDPAAPPPPISVRCTEPVQF